MDGLHIEPLLFPQIGNMLQQPSDLLAGFQDPLTNPFLDKSLAGMSFQLPADFKLFSPSEVPLESQLLGDARNMQSQEQQQTQPMQQETQPQQAQQQQISQQQQQQIPLLPQQQLDNLQQLLQQQQQQQQKQAHLSLLGLGDMFGLFPNHNHTNHNNNNNHTAAPSPHSLPARLPLMGTSTENPLLSVIIGKAQRMDGASPQHQQISNQEQNGANGMMSGLMTPISPAVGSAVATPSGLATNGVNNNSAFGLSNPIAQFQYLHHHQQQQQQQTPVDGGLPGLIGGRRRRVTGQRRAPRAGASASTGRSSKYRGVTKHRRSGRFEAHIWVKELGRQVYLGGYECEEHAAEAYDIAALKSKGTRTKTNFDLTKYTDLLGCIDRMTMEELVMAVRRQSQGFSRGTSSFRGVTHHPSGRWEARIGIPGSKHVYLGLFADEKEAARAYDRALVRLRGGAAATNFSLAEYRGEMGDYHRMQSKMLSNDPIFAEISSSAALYERWVKQGGDSFPELDSPDSGQSVHSMRSGSAASGGSIGAAAGGDGLGGTPTGPGLGVGGASLGLGPAAVAIQQQAGLLAQQALQVAYQKQE